MVRNCEKKLLTDSSVHTQNSEAYQKSFCDAIYSPFKNILSSNLRPLLNFAFFYSLTQFYHFHQKMTYFDQMDSIIDGNYIRRYLTRK